MRRSSLPSFALGTTQKNLPLSILYVSVKIFSIFYGGRENENSLISILIVNLITIPTCLKTITIFMFHCPSNGFGLPYHVKRERVRVPCAGWLASVLVVQFAVGVW